MSSYFVVSSEKSEFHYTGLSQYSPISKLISNCKNLAWVDFKVFVVHIFSSFQGRNSSICNLVAWYTVWCCRCIKCRFSLLLSFLGCLYPNYFTVRLGYNPSTLNVKITRNYLRENSTWVCPSLKQCAVKIVKPKIRDTPYVRRTHLHYVNIYTYMCK